MGNGRCLIILWQIFAELMYRDAFIPQNCAFLIMCRHFLLYFFSPTTTTAQMEARFFFNIASNSFGLKIGSDDKAIKVFTNYMIFAFFKNATVFLICLRVTRSCMGKDTTERAVFSAFGHEPCMYLTK